MRATDPEGDEIVYTLHSRGPTLVGNRLTWTPGDADVGDHTLEVGARDAVNDPVYQQLAVYVRPRDNLAPVISPVPDISAKVGEIVRFTLVVSDPNPQDNIAVSMRRGTVPPRAAFADQTFTWAPQEDDVGNHAVIFDASDGRLTTSLTVAIEISNTNRAPVFLPIGPRTVEAGERLTFTVTATDADDDPVTVRARSLPAGAEFNGAEFSWAVPSEQAAGEHHVTFVASDDDAASADAEMTVRIEIAEGAVHRLTVSRTGYGRVWSRPGGIDCGTDCTHTYGQGARVELVALAEPGYRFLAWNGCAVEEDSPETCTIRMTEAADVTARFETVGETFRDCAECPEMVELPAGSFTMGAPESEAGSSARERPVHEVTFAAPFAVGVREVTFAEWDACVADGGCGGHRPDDAGWGRGTRPVIHVSWDDAKRYVEWLSGRTGESYRLLSESEWEYAARAGTGTAYSWGDEVGVNRANCAGCGSEWDGRTTAPAGSFAANAWGLHDMHGNVWEWVEDCWSGSYAGAPADGGAWLGGNCAERGLRGGSWHNDISSLRAAGRAKNTTGVRLNRNGFRVARTPAPGEETDGRPTVTARIPAQSSVTGRRTLELSDYFADDQALTYRVVSSDAGVLSVSVAGGVLTLTPVSAGRADVTVTARDPDGNEVAQTFEVTVDASADGGRVVGEKFRDCDECPEMVELPAGSFTMGAPESEAGSRSDERPVHQVTIATPFAVGVREVTFAEWDACVADGGCGGHRPDDAGWGRGTRPVIHVSWDDAKRYVEWLSGRTGESYRLLSESEWEYAARAGTGTAYSWGDEVGVNRANCAGCGSEWDGRTTAPAGSFAANAWGLHDMHGNVWEWTEDCRNGSYAGAPRDGSAWLSGDCAGRVVRGGSAANTPSNLRAANRAGSVSGARINAVGFRVARTPAPGEETDGRPTVTARIPAQSSVTGRRTLELSDYFADDQALTYRVVSSDAGVLRVSVAGGVLTLTPVSAGRADVTVTARDPDGNEVAQTFEVTVDASADGGRVVGEKFRDCDECPEMAAVPAGSFTMGAPESEAGSRSDERPVHQVTVATPFAVGVREVTFAEWDACVADGGCGGHRPDDAGWGRGTRPVVHVSWDDAKRYVEWLSGRTGESYRLLSESEWEYAARAGTGTAYSWGDEVGVNRANCAGCGSEWDGRTTAPAGSFAANAWGLHDMHGNVWEWTEDCRNGSYAGAPRDGSAWLSGDCAGRVVRGGSAANTPSSLRAANRAGSVSGARINAVGFRVARTLAPGGSGGSVAGALGAGQDKWRLKVESDGPISVMSLPESPAAHLTSLSTSGLGQPVVVATMPDRSLVAGGHSALDLSEHFADDRALTYLARSSDAEVLRVSVAGGVLTLTPVTAGRSMVTVTARDPDGNEATHNFSVTVVVGGFEIAGSVVNFFTGEAIPNAAVKLTQRRDGVSRDLGRSTSSIDGSFRADVDATRPGRINVRADASGFASQSKIVEAVASQDQASVALRLLPVQQEVALQPTDDAEVAVGGQRVLSLPANSLVDASGSVVIDRATARVTVLDPSVEPSAMPGDFLGIDINAGERGPIESYGAMDVEFVNDDGEALDLGAGQQATVSVPLADRRDPGDAPRTVPLYYWSDKMGMWVEEGEAALREISPGRWAYVGSVSRIRTWSAGAPFETATVYGCVADPDGNAPANVRVVATGVDYIGRSETVADGQGLFDVAVRPDSVVLLTATAGSQTSRHALPTRHGEVLGECLAISQSAAKITLIWGENLRDLDSHLRGPDGAGGNFHVYFANPSVEIGNATVALAADDTDSFGPEVITISSFPFAGRYRYFVHRYGGSGSILDSPARVEVNLGGEISIFSPAGATGTSDGSWVVFDIEVGEDLVPWLVGVQQFADDDPTSESQSGAVVGAPSGPQRHEGPAPDGGRVPNPMSSLVEKKYYAK